MALTKCKLGELVKQSTKRNKDLKIKNIQGVNSSSEFCKTKANTTGLDFGNYKIVKTEQFAYNPSRINLGSIALLDDTECIVSPMYVVFEVSDKSKLLPQYLMMWFGRKEFQRSTLFYATGSVRDTFGFDAMCDIEISLPPISVQRKYVDVYNALLSNQRVYERSLEDLKLTCDGHIENLRRNMGCEEIGEYISECNKRNKSLGIKKVQGVNNSGKFCKTKANTKGLNFSNYKIVRKDQFTYNPSRINLGSIALLDDTECIVSPMYVVFEVSDKSKLLPQYLMMWFGRKEFQRSTLFYATGSVRDTFGFDAMCKVKIPIPPIETQQAITNLYNAYTRCEQLSKRLKTQAQSICPILVKGSLDEARNRKTY